MQTVVVARRVSETRMEAIMFNVPHHVVEWMDYVINKGYFSNRSEVIRYALYVLMNKMREEGHLTIPGAVANVKTETGEVVRVDFSGISDGIVKIVFTDREPNMFVNTTAEVTLGLIEDSRLRNEDIVSIEVKINLPQKSKALKAVRKALTPW